MKPKVSSVLLFSLVVTAACINHLLTFLAYDWYNGIDGYSYDVCGLQLISGKVFDLFPILFRPPLVPVLKNMLYVIFEGHPYALSIFLHMIGIATVALAYRLGNRFHKAVGFSLGMLFALNLSLSVHFHFISSVTFFVPLVVLSADRFILWIQKPTAWSLTALVVVTSLSFLARAEAFVFIPFFSIFGWLAHRRWKHAVLFFLACLLTYNLTCLFYYSRFGYWGITYNKGWSLFIRLTRAKDHQFDIRNGPASRKVYEYLRAWIPAGVSLDELAQLQPLVGGEDGRRFDAFLPQLGLSDQITLLQRQMYTFNLAQQDLGYREADRLFMQAGIEAIRSDPEKFARFTVVRLFGQLGLYDDPGLAHKEFDYTTESGHIFGFQEERMQKKDALFRQWLASGQNTGSPFQWERRFMKAGVSRLFGIQSALPELPGYFRMQQNAMVKSGLLYRLKCGDGNMEERFWNCRDLDAFFFLGFWGQRWHSLGALRIVREWDKLLMPKGAVRIVINYSMFALWVIAVFLAQSPLQRMTLAAFLCISIGFAFIQSVFSDNFGGRFELHMVPFLWLGFLCGVLTIDRRYNTRKDRYGSDTVGG